MKIIYSILFSLGATSIIAQNELPSGQIEVIKNFEARLTETKKIRIFPQPIALDSTLRKYEYNLLAPSPPVDYVIPELKPLSLSPEQKSAYYPFFAKAGYGSPNSLLGQFSYDHRQNEFWQWGIDFRHLSANNKKIPLQKFSDSRGRINASYMLKENIQLEGYVDGHYETVYFYGADPIPSNPDALKRNFKRYDAHFSIANLRNLIQGYRYKAFFQYLFDKDDLGSRESSIRIGGELENSIGAKSYPLGIKVSGDFTTLKDSREQYVNNFHVEPFFQFFTGGLKVHLGGVALFSSNKSVIQTNENEILPAIELSYNLSKNSLILKTGWQGEVVKMNFHYLSSYNPYIRTRLDSIGNRITRRIYAGINGTSGTLQYEVTGGYSQFKRMAFFLQANSDKEQFNPIYDDGSYFGFQGSARFEGLKNLILHVQVWQRIYHLDNEEKPWHMPSFGMEGTLAYSGGDDVYHVSFILHSENGVPYRTVGGTTGRLGPLIDLNLHGDYYITSALGAFVELNNLLGNKRERWFTYPAYGFNAKAGVLFRL